MSPRALPAAWLAASQRGGPGLARQVALGVDAGRRPGLADAAAGDRTGGHYRRIGGRPVGDPDALDTAVAAAAGLEADGLCRVKDRRVTIPAGAYRLMRVLAACFDGHLPTVARRHARAV